MKTYVKKIVSFCTIGTGLLYGSTMSAQGVGIGTANPQATLHVAGTVRIDSIRNVTLPKKIAVFDTAGVIGYSDIDSIRKTVIQSGSSGILYFSSDSVKSMSGNIPQTCMVFTLPAGSYALQAHCEIYNSGYLYASRVALSDSAGNEISYGVPYSSPGEFSPWSGGGSITIPITTYFRIQFWGAYNTTTYIRRIRVIATKI